MNKSLTVEFILVSELNGGFEGMLISIYCITNTVNNSFIDVYAKYCVQIEKP